MYQLPRFCLKKITKCGRRFPALCAKIALLPFERDGAFS